MLYTGLVNLAKYANSEIKDGYKVNNHDCCNEGVYGKAVAIWEKTIQNKQYRSSLRR